MTVEKHYSPTVRVGQVVSLGEVTQRGARGKLEMSPHGEKHHKQTERANRDDCGLEQTRMSPKGMAIENWEIKISQPREEDR